MASNLLALARRLHSDVPIGSSILREYQHNPDNAHQPNTHGLLFRLADNISRTWDLGFTAFGGPPVHFQIVHRRFVESRDGKVPWLDEQTYQELFAVCQSLPGPASTKMVFCVNLLHSGLTVAIAGFFVWSLPGAIGMYALSLGVARIGDTLPLPVYGLISGLNAATVGIIALAAVQLASKAITDPLTRTLIIAGACAGLCYSALWYYPVLMVAGGCVTVVWDIWLSRIIGKLRARLHRCRRRGELAAECTSQLESIELERVDLTSGPVQRRAQGPGPATNKPDTERIPTPRELNRSDVELGSQHVSAWLGISVIVGFFAILVARGVLNPPPLAYGLFSNMYLAGTIIFGGGPVVIPLLREYVVQPGWVSSRDFLIGLAIIQAFPGPNFNFAVYLGALAVRSTGIPTVVGAVLGFIGIFTPGLILAYGIQGLWRPLRTKASVISALRGINASAVGLIFTAVYRLWELGYLTPSRNNGQSLALEPWWVVVAVLSYSGSAWFKVPPAAAVVIGAALGLLWYAAVGHRILATY